MKMNKRLRAALFFIILFSIPIGAISFDGPRSFEEFKQVLVFRECPESDLDFITLCFSLPVEEEKLYNNLNADEKRFVRRELYYIRLGFHRGDIKLKDKWHKISVGKQRLLFEIDFDKDIYILVEVIEVPYKLRSRRVYGKRRSNKNINVKKTFCKSNQCQVQLYNKIDKAKHC